MATAIGNLIIRVGGQTGGAQRAMMRLQGVVASTAGMVKRLAMSFVGLGAGLGFAGMLRSGERFNRAMRNSLAIMGNVSDAMEKRMRKAAFVTAKETGHAASEVAGAFYYLASAGLDAERSVGALGTVARFSRAGMFDLRDATSLLTDAQSALGLKSHNIGENLANMTYLSDMLVKANTLADASVREFAEGLAGPLAGALRANNRSVTEGVALLALLAERGQKGAEASQAASILYRDIPRALSKNEAAWKRYDIAVTNAVGNMLSMPQMLVNLTSGLADLSDLERAAAMDAMGLTRSVRDITMKLFDGGKEVKNFEAALAKAGGTTAEVASKQLTPLQKGLATLSAGFTELGSKIMKAIGPPLEKGLTAIGNFVGKADTHFLNLWDKIQIGALDAIQGIIDAFPWMEEQFIDLGVWNRGLCHDHYRKHKGWPAGITEPLRRFRGRSQGIPSSDSGRTGGYRAGGGRNSHRWQGRDYD
jgi:TP901 family phage tail tape measure protein